MQHPANVMLVTQWRPDPYLSPQARKVVEHLLQAGSVSSREAMIDLDMTSATLARRICDLEAVGYVINRERKKHPTTGKRYTRYSLA